jgi:hypothetical protein
MRRDTALVFRLHALPSLPGAARRCWLGVVFSCQCTSWAMTHEESRSREAQCRDTLLEHPLCWPALQVIREHHCRGRMSFRNPNERTRYSVQGAVHAPINTLVIRAALYSVKGDHCFCEVLDFDGEIVAQTNDGLLLQVHDYADVHPFGELTRAANLPSLRALTRQRQRRVRRLCSNPLSITVRPMTHEQRRSNAASFVPGKDFRTMEGWPS